GAAAAATGAPPRQHRSRQPAGPPPLPQRLAPVEGAARCRRSSPRAAATRRTRSIACRRWRRSSRSSPFPRWRMRSWGTRPTSGTRWRGRPALWWRRSCACFALPTRLNIEPQSWSRRWHASRCSCRSPWPRATRGTESASATRMRGPQSTPRSSRCRCRSSRFWRADAASRSAGRTTRRRSRSLSAIPASSSVSFGAPGSSARRSSLAQLLVDTRSAFSSWRRISCR
ncbi:unnamed protein product, partial [Prorocentrum cordatum]